MLRCRENGGVAGLAGFPSGGEGGIRTHGTVSRTLAFEASAFNRSATSPRSFDKYFSRQLRCGLRLIGDLWQKLTPLGEERLDDGGAFRGQDTGGHVNLMIQPRVGENFEAGADCAAFWVISAIDNTGDSGLNDGTSTHAAGLNGDVERGVG